MDYSEVLRQISMSSGIRLTLEHSVTTCAKVHLPQVGTEERPKNVMANELSTNRVRNSVVSNSKNQCVLRREPFLRELLGCATFASENAKRR